MSMHLSRIQLATTAAVALAGLATVAACGTSTQPSSSPSTTGSTATVSASSVNGVPVLVDRSGATLYTNDQDTGTVAHCTSSDCTATWPPLTVPGGQRPTAGSGVSGTLGTVQRPDGSRQVTLDGKPLYTFSFDHGAGQATGNGTQDSFGGMAFTWHGAVAAREPTPAPAAPGGGYGGY